MSTLLLDLGNTNLDILVNKAQLVVRLPGKHEVVGSNRADALCNGTLWYSDFATLACSKFLSKIRTRCMTWH